LLDQQSAAPIYRGSPRDSRGSSPENTDVAGGPGEHIRMERFLDVTKSRRGTGAWPKIYERLPETVAGLHVVAFACLMRHCLITVAAQSP
jgi:hypothetical protein